MKFLCLAVLLVVNTLVAAPSVCEKPVWLEKAFNAIESGKYPRLKAAAYWHETFSDAKTKTDLSIDSSPKSLKTYKTHVADVKKFVTEAAFVDSPTGKKLAAPATGLYLGAFPDFGGTEDSVTPKRIVDFETLSGRKLAWAYFSNNWYDGISFPGEQVAVLKAQGRVPFIRLMMRSREGGLPDPKYTLQGFLDGKHDAALKQWAVDAKKAAVPMILEFGTEVNGDWFPWSAKFNGIADGPRRFKETYRRIARLFSESGLKDVTWVLHLDSNSAPEAPWNTYEAYYPGDDVVDWIGMSVYGSRGDPECEPFETTMERAYPKLAAISANKPLAVLEWGIIEKKAPEKKTVKPKQASLKGTRSSR